MPFVLLAAFVYMLAAVAGWIYSEDLDILKLQFEQLAERFQGLGPFEFMARIFVHNLVASYLAMCLVVLYGLIPLCLAAFNGLLLGWFAGWMEGVSWIQLAFLLVPHGIFEWPAMFVAFGVGIWRGLGHLLGSETLSWFQRWKKAHLVYLFFVVPLLFVAAVVESRYHF